MQTAKVAVPFGFWALLEDTLSWVSTPPMERSKKHVKSRNFNLSMPSSLHTSATFKKTLWQQGRIANRICSKMNR